MLCNRTEINSKYKKTSINSISDNNFLIYLLLYFEMLFYIFIAIFYFDKTQIFCIPIELFHLCFTPSFLNKLTIFCYFIPVLFIFISYFNFLFLFCFVIFFSFNSYRVALHCKGKFSKILFSALLLSDLQMFSLLFSSLFNWLLNIKWFRIICKSISY